MVVGDARTGSERGGVLATVDASSAAIVGKNSLSDLQAMWNEPNRTGEMGSLSCRQKDEQRRAWSRIRSAAPWGHVSAAAIPAVRSKGVGRRALLAALSVLALAAIPGRVMAADPDGMFQRVNGLVIYFAVIPAAFILGHPAEHTGREMHGDPPAGRYVHHLIVALFDSTTGMRITDANVAAVVQGGRQPSATRIELASMTIGGAQAYGGFTALPPRDRYRIEIHVVRPGAAAVRAVFSHQHLQP